MPAFRVKLSTNDLNCVDVPLNPTHSLMAEGQAGQSASTNGVGYKPWKMLRM